MPLRYILEWPILGLKSIIYKKELLLTHGVVVGIAHNIVSENASYMLHEFYSWLFLLICESLLCVPLQHLKVVILKCGVIQVKELLLVVGSHYWIP